jgi:hypothetical protein
MKTSGSWWCSGPRERFVEGVHWPVWQWGPYLIAHGGDSLVAIPTELSQLMQDGWVLRNSQFIVNYAFNSFSYLLFVCLRVVPWLVE